MELNGHSGTSMLRAQLDIFKWLSPKRILDLGLRFGPYGGRFLSPTGLSIRKLKKVVHGVDLGPLLPCLPERLCHPSKRIQLAPELLVQDIERVKSTFIRRPQSVNGKYDLSLIGRRHLRSNNSWMHNSLSLVKGKERCTLLMHPDDASARGVVNHQKVRVDSRVGSLEIVVEITDNIMSGVVSIPHGWGHHRPNIQLQTARKVAGVSINDLTDDRSVDVLSGNAAFSGVPVKVKPIDAPNS